MFLLARIGFPLELCYRTWSAQLFPSQRGRVAWSRAGRYLRAHYFLLKFVVNGQLGYGQPDLFIGRDSRLSYPEVRRVGRSCARAYGSSRNFPPRRRFDALSSRWFIQKVSIRRAERFRERARALSPASAVFTLRGGIERADRSARTMSLHPRLADLSGAARLLSRTFLANRVIGARL